MNATVASNDRGLSRHASTKKAIRTGDAPFNRCADVIVRVRTHMTHYEKADAEVIKQLLPRLSTAVENARWLEPRNHDNNHNPATNIHHLIDHFAETQANNRSETAA